MTPDQEIRAKALELAIAWDEGNETEMLDRAERVAQWITTGRRPPQQPGMVY